MRAAQAGLLALVLNSGCLRFGYEIARKNEAPDASHLDAGVIRDAAVADATPARDAAVGGAGGRTSYAAGTGGAAGKVAGAGGNAAGASGAGGSAGQPNAGASGSAGAAGTAADSGVEDPVLGDTGLLLSDVLGYYTATFLSGGNWGDMVLRRNGAAVWGVYNYREGTIVGEINDDGVLVGWWSEAPTRDGYDAGEVELRWLQSGSRIEFDGRWRYGTSGGWWENWEASQVTNRSPPNDLVARFLNTAEFKRHP